MRGVTSRPSDAELAARQAALQAEAGELLAALDLAESQAFERIHEDAYRRLGFDLVDIPAGAVTERAAVVDAHIRSWA